jgi:hypothetical protein
MEAVNEMHDSTKELVDEWSKPTETKGPAAVQPKAPVEPGNNLADPVTAEEPEKPKERLSVETTAEIMIGSFGITQALVLSPVIKGRIKRKVGEENFEPAMEMMALVMDGKKAFNDLTEQQQKWYIRIKDLYKTLEELPFTDAESEQLKKPLLKIIKESNYDIPPNLGMFLVSMEVMAPRLTSAFFD